MSESQIVVRYAKALFDFALEKEQIEAVKDDFVLIYSVCENNEIIYLLKNPTIRPSEKKKHIKSIFENNISSISLNFINLLIDNRRERFLFAIIRRILANYQGYKGIKSAIFESAIEFDEATVLQIQNMAKTAFNAEIELKKTFNEKLIGGFVLTVDDQQFDSSVSSKLKKINKELINTSV